MVRHLRIAERHTYFLPVLLLIALGCWALSSPVGSSPDDDYHLASIWCGLGERESLCEQASSTGLFEVPAGVTSMACWNFHNDENAYCGISELAQNGNDLLPTSRGNFGEHAHDYPPVYYGFMSFFVSKDFVFSAMLIRFVNIIMFIVSMGGAFAALPRSLRPPLILSALATSIPLGVFLITSTNPSAWAILSSLLVWVTLYGFFHANGRRKVVLGLLATYATIVGAGARADAAVFAGLAIVLATFLSLRRSRSFALSCILSTILLGISFLSFVYSGQSAVTSPDEVQRSSDIALLFDNALQVPSLVMGVFGTWALGWIDTTMPAVVWFAAFSGFVGIVFLGLSRVGWQKALSLVIVGVMIVGIPLYILQNEGIKVGVGVQPRYILPLIILFTGLSLLYSNRAVGAMSQAQQLFIIATFSVANAVALYVNTKRYVTGLGKDGITLHVGPDDWWWNGFPLSPTVVVLIGSVAFTIAAYLVVRLAVDNSRPISTTSDANMPV